MEKLIIAKQASDLQSNYLSQRIIYEYLRENKIEKHIEKIRELYKKQRSCMVESIERHFPDNVTITRPEGGMFLWVTLPKGYSSLKLFDIVIKKNVAFVPGDPFYAGKENVNTLRLNYTNSDEERIDAGIKILAEGIKELMKN